MPKYAPRIYPPATWERLLSLMPQRFRAGIRQLRTAMRSLPEDCDACLWVECGEGCGSMYVVPVNSAKHLARQTSGMLAQDAYPHLHRADRELLITGICRRCWDQMFGPGPGPGPDASRRSRLRYQMRLHLRVAVKRLHMAADRLHTTIAG